MLVIKDRNGHTGLTGHEEHLIIKTRLSTSIYWNGIKSRNDDIRTGIKDMHIVTIILKKSLPNDFSIFFYAFQVQINGILYQKKKI